MTTEQEILNRIANRLDRCWPVGIYQLSLTPMERHVLLAHLCGKKPVNDQPNGFQGTTIGGLQT